MEIYEEKAIRHINYNTMILLFELTSMKMADV
jgi:hypothetical protein